MPHRTEYDRQNSKISMENQCFDQKHVMKNREGGRFGSAAHDICLSYARISRRLPQGEVKTFLAYLTETFKVQN